MSYEEACRAFSERLAKLEERAEQLVGRAMDHEDRIRKVETHMVKVVSVSATIAGLVGSAVGSIIMKALVG